MNAILEITEDRFGNWTVRPVSERLRRWILRNTEADLNGDCSLYLQVDWHRWDFAYAHLDRSHVRDIEWGHGARVKVDYDTVTWMFGVPQ